MDDQLYKVWKNLLYNIWVKYIYLSLYTEHCKNKNLKNFFEKHLLEKEKNDYLVIEFRIFGSYFNN